MKKLLTVLLILALLPACSLAYEDPIVGIWYFDMDYSDAPDPSYFKNYTNAIFLLHALPTGELARFEIDITQDHKQETLDYTITGKWKRTGSNMYTLSIVGVGENMAFMKDGVLHAILYKDTYTVLHKMIPLDWYNDLYLRN